MTNKAPLNYTRFHQLVTIEPKAQAGELSDTMSEELQQAIAIANAAPLLLFALSVMSRNFRYENTAVDFMVLKWAQKALDAAKPAKEAAPC